MVCLIGSLVATVFCLPLIDTVVTQIQLMVPSPATPTEKFAIDQAQQAWRADRRVSNTIAMFARLRHADPPEQELASWEGTDPGNALATWAAVLVDLRHAGITCEPAMQPAASQAASAPATQPASAPQLEDRVAAVLRDQSDLPPLRTSLMRYREIVVDTLTSRGLSARQAVALADTLRSASPFTDCRPVLRELADRLIGLGQRYAQQKRPADAANAYAAAIRICTDIVQDSSLPDVALLASERLPAAIQGFAEAAPASRPRASQAITAIEQFRRDWLVTNDREVSILPMMPEPSPAPDEQSHVLGAMALAVGLLACGWLIAVVCLFEIGIVLAGRAFGKVPVIWHNKWSPLVATAVVVVPIVTLLAVLVSGRVPFVWLLSMPSLAAMILLGGTVLMWWMLATALFLRPRTPTAQPVLPWTALAGGGLLIVLAMAAVAWVQLSGGLPAWQAPMSVQIVRKLGIAAGLACIPVVSIWTIWSWRRRRAAGVHAGTWARAGLAVASPAMFVLLTLAVIALGVNRYRDTAYDTAFAAAARKPVAARLGSDWWDRYFAPARSLVNGPESMSGSGSSAATTYLSGELAGRESTPS